MKKLSIVILVTIFIFSGCQIKKTDYSEYSFTDVSWIRDSGYDTETITFNSDGTYGYSCACGNPVNDADLCETYTYDDKTKEIKLNCFETTNETIETIKIIESNEKTLKLDFGGEIRIFNVEE